MKHAIQHRRTLLMSAAIGLAALLSPVLASAAVIAQASSQLELTLTALSGDLYYSVAIPSISQNISTTTSGATATNTDFLQPPNSTSPISVGDRFIIGATIFDSATDPNSSAQSLLEARNSLFLFSTTGASLSFEYTFTGSASSSIPDPADSASAEASFDIQQDGASQWSNGYFTSGNESDSGTMQGSFQLTLSPISSTTLDIYALAAGNVHAHNIPGSIPAPGALLLLAPGLLGLALRRRKGICK